MLNQEKKMFLIKNIKYKNKKLLKKTITSIHMQT